MYQKAIEAPGGERVRGTKRERGAAVKMEQLTVQLRLGIGSVACVVSSNLVRPALVAFNAVIRSEIFP